MGFGQSSVFAKIGFILIIFAFVTQVLGIAIPYWYDLDIVYSGIFKGCSVLGCVDIINPSAWLGAVQAMELLGVIAILFALVLSVITVFVKDMKVLKLICWILCFFACAVIITGIIIYGAKVYYFTNHKYSGAFAITIVAGIVILIAGVMVLLDWMGKGAQKR